MRKKIDATQMSKLQRVFANTSYPKRATVRQLAQQTGLHEHKIYAWFKQNRRKVLPAGEKRTSSMCEYTQCMYVCVCIYV